MPASSVAACVMASCLSPSSSPPMVRSSASLAGWVGLAGLSESRRRLCTKHVAVWMVSVDVVGLFDKREKREGQQEIQAAGEW